MAVAVLTFSEGVVGVRGLLRLNCCPSSFILNFILALFKLASVVQTEDGDVSPPSLSDDELTLCGYSNEKPCV